MTRQYLHSQHVEKVNRQIKATISKTINEQRIDGGTYSTKAPLLHKGLQQSDLLFVGLHPFSPGKKALGNRIKAIVENLPKALYEDQATWQAVLDSFRDIEQHLCTLTKKYHLRLSWRKLTNHLIKHYATQHPWLRDEVLKLEHWTAKRGLGHQPPYKPYFGLVQKMTANIDPDYTWEHIDVFPLRASTEAKLWALFPASAYGYEVGKRFLRSYGPLLEQDSLKAVIVTHKQAWEVMKPLTSSENFERFGCYWYQHTPVFPAGSLDTTATGEESYNRLSWHIRHVIEKTNKV